MKEHRIVHDTFTIERTFAEPAERVFQALANPEIKARWFVGPPEWKQSERSMDFAWEAASV